MGREKNPRVRRKKRKKLRPGRLGLGGRLKHHLGAIDLDAKLGANNPGANDPGAKVVAM